MAPPRGPRASAGHRLPSEPSPRACSRKGVAVPHHAEWLLCWVGASRVTTRSPSAPAVRGQQRLLQPPPETGPARQDPVTAVSPFPTPRRPPARVALDADGSHRAASTTLSRGVWGSRATGGRGTSVPASAQPGAPGGCNRWAQRNQRGGGSSHAGEHGQARTPKGHPGRQPRHGSCSSSCRSQGQGAIPRAGGGAQPPVSAPAPSSTCKAPHRAWGRRTAGHTPAQPSPHTQPLPATGHGSQGVRATAAFLKPDLVGQINN